MDLQLLPGSLGGESSVSLFKAVLIIINIRGFYPEAPRGFKSQGHPVLPAVPQVAGQCPTQPLPVTQKVSGGINSRGKRPVQIHRPRREGTLRDIPRAAACN